MFEKALPSKALVSQALVLQNKALPGRLQKMPVSSHHFVHSHSLVPPFPGNMQFALFGMGCFWGAEKKFWQIGGVYSTAVGSAAGYTANPTYDEVCSCRSGHNEVGFVVFDPGLVSFATLLITFWEAHNPTQGMRQGNDVGTQYRSGIYYYDKTQKQFAEKSKAQYQILLANSGYGDITTEFIQAPEFYYAEDYHQQYLAKDPNAYCGLGGTGVGYSKA